MNTLLSEHTTPSGPRLLLVQGDITEEHVDAIVNAANSHLQHGGGVAAAIVRKGGATIQQESNTIGFVPVGEAAVTSGGSLPCKYVIHAVGPVWGSGDEDNKLRNAVWNSLRLADERGLESISMPAISSGIFGFPKDRCADILLATVGEFLAAHPNTTLKQVRFCLFDSPTVEAFRAAWRRKFGEQI